MAHGSNIRSSDPRNYQTPGSVCLFFRKKGSTDNADWKSLGNIVGPSIAPVVELLEHFSQRRGLRAKDRVVVSERSADLNFSIDEINRDNLQFAFGSKQAPVDSTFKTNHERIFTNPGGGQTIDLEMTDLDAGSLIVRSVDLEPVETTYATPADYTVVVATGIVTIVALGALDNPVTVPEIHIFWTKTIDTQKFTIFDGEELEGEAKFQVFTPGGIQYAIEFKNVQIRNNGDITVGDGTTFQEIALTMEILVDSSGNLGTMHIVDQADAFA